MRTVLGVLCTIMALMSFSVALVGLVEIVSGVATAGSYGAFGFLAGLGGLSSWGAARNFRRRRDRAALAAADDPAKVILQLAAVEGGRFTVTEVVAKTPLSLPQARTALAQMSQDNMLSSVVTEQGVEVFTVHGLLGPAAKAAARDILDA
jgi:hypothetical protein